MTRRRLLVGAIAASGGFAATAAGGVALTSTGLLGEPIDDQPATSLAGADAARPTVPPLTPLRPPPLIITEQDAAEWQLFKQRFVTADGRIIDTGKGGVSHSEGQGLGLFFAVTFDDRPTFDRVLKWTTRNLRRSGDALHIWCYQPNAANPIPDVNSATDGDLFIAAALARAAARWGNASYATAAAAIAKDILRLLVAEVGPRTVLLPGAFGFDKPDAVVVNPSYYALPLFPDLAAVAPSPKWARLRADGLSLIADGRFGRWRLPPDWLLASRHDGALSPAPMWPARFSYDAIRVPLYLSWAGAWRPMATDFAGYYATTQPHLPAWVDLVNNNVAPYDASPGMQAVAMFVTRTSDVSTVASLPALKSSLDYYSAALTLMARIAWQETPRA